MSYLARKRCTCPNQLTIFDKSHSDWSGAPRPAYPEITPGVSSTPVKDGGQAAAAALGPNNPIGQTLQRELTQQQAR
jgi:hypothetical protein